MGIETNNKIRISDIAKLAGVSVGTVDRVIHNRGEVSEVKRSHIQEIIEKLNYRPNLLARSLASKQVHLIATLLPENKFGKSYWEAPLLGIQKGWKEMADFNIRLINVFFDLDNAQSFAEKADELLKYKPDAVLIAPIFKEQSLTLTKSLDSLSIPYVFIDSNIEDAKSLSYFGQHSFQSGYLAARLLQMGLPDNGSITIVEPLKSKNSNQLQNREKGFMAYFEQEKLLDKYNFLKFDYNIDYETDRLLLMEKFLSKNQSIKAIVVFNSRVHETANCIEKLNYKGIRLIGYDLIKENVECLRKGTVTFLIAQRPEEQGYLGIKTLFNYLTFKQDNFKIQYGPMDILTKENIDYYWNFNSL